MAWLQRLFGINKPQNAQVSPNPGPAPAATAATNTTAQETIPPERMGLTGEYDQSGLAKRVALAFDQDAEIDDIETVFVAQTGGTVVLKGKAPNQAILSKMVNVARTVRGATSVDTSQVEVG